ncbi:salicylate hydroxylase [Penicillium chermesinum]|uniref:Salicylate hydroxylase n=1 Tax=Penicillium chermesinum TaxID=63820 RepID=A0A9W9NIV0_9EURO|nr:salicylate hydroxylase [Penicillium chermesinum]KAJ5220558.1 salicylate hydroxylase [Penicillium chermesinum]KAJ6157984.1 salicylate hydroxylase [Penicillium chermesinum]
MPSTVKEVHTGIVGAGIGGLAAAIALRRAGAQVTVLESAEQLTEIGAGIQMTPNVSVLLQRWGVDKVIGDNLVQFEELNMRRKDGTRVGYTKIATLEESLGRPWWVVHRAHLHEGLVKIAKSLGAKILINSAVASIRHESADKVFVETANGASYTFDFLIGADGINSITRRTLFPTVTPEPPTTNCAYRALVPYDEIRKDPIAKELIEKKTMEVWMAENAYIITYPISAGNLFNLVLSHHRPEKLRATVPEVPIEELRNEYKDFDPRIKRIVDMIDHTSRWPLMMTGPLDSWSSPRKNVVLMGDAAHSMVNHMAQGAATSMEDGAFLARCIGKVVEGKIRLDEAVRIYEQERMPKAHAKQQVSFINGAIWHLPDGPAQRARDKVMEPELHGKYYVRSSNLYGDPQTVLSVYGYDAEEHAEIALATYLNHNREPFDPATGVTKSLQSQYMDWFLPSSRGEKPPLSKM